MKQNGSEETAKPRAHDDPRATVNIEGQWYAPEEVEQVGRQNAARRAGTDKQTRDAWEDSPHGKFCMALYEAFQAYRTYLEQNPHARKTIWGSQVEYDEHKLFEHGLRTQTRARREAAQEPGEGTGSGPLRARVFGRTAMQGSETEGREAMPHA